jgi:hypothetical protein
MDLKKNEALRLGADAETARRLASDLAELTRRLSARELARVAVTEYYAGRQPAIPNGVTAMRLFSSESPVDRAARMVNEAAGRLQNIDGFFDPELHSLAMTLTSYTRTSPLSGKELQGRLNCDERTVKSRIAELRTRWALPIGSVRATPGGYFFITELEEFRAWVRSFTKQPLDELRTVRALARRHFPELSGQLGFNLSEEEAL